MIDGEPEHNLRDDAGRIAPLAGKPEALCAQETKVPHVMRIKLIGVIRSESHLISVQNTLPSARSQTEGRHEAAPIGFWGKRQGGRTGGRMSRASHRQSFKKRET